MTKQWRHDMTKQRKQEHLGSISLLEWFFSRGYTPSGTFAFQANTRNHLVDCHIWATKTKQYRCRKYSHESWYNCGQGIKENNFFFFFHAGTTTHWGISFLLEELRTLHVVLCVVVRDLWRQRWPTSGLEEIQWAGGISGPFSVHADYRPVPSGILRTNR